MEVAYFVLGLIAIMGTYSIYRNGKKSKVIYNVIQRFLDEEKATLVSLEKPRISGPFEDELYDSQGINLYQNLGYTANETAYRKILYTTSDRSELQEAWVQIRIERLQATYIEWMVSAD
jgi:hypothetical protein